MSCLFNFICYSAEDDVTVDDFLADGVDDRVVDDDPVLSTKQMEDALHSMERGIDDAKAPTWL